MAYDSDKLEGLKIFNDNIQSEAKTHCNRNSYFLVVTSILLLALSQFNNKYLIQLAICSMGVLLSIVWFLMHWRSGEYIKYWKNQAEKLSAANNLPSIYPKNQIGGYEVRKLGLIIPIAFIIFWCFIFIKIFLIP